MVSKVDQAIAQMQREVERATTTQESMVALLNNATQAMEDAKDDPDQIMELAAQLRASSDELGNAINANIDRTRQAELDGERAEELERLVRQGGGDEEGVVDEAGAQEGAENITEEDLMEDKGYQDEADQSGVDPDAEQEQTLEDQEQAHNSTNALSEDELEDPEREENRDTPASVSPASNTRV